MELPGGAGPHLFWSVAATCVVLVGIAKAGFGGGIGVIATPLMSLVAPPEVAAGIMLPVLCVCDWFSIAHYRGAFDRRSAVLMLPPAMLGIAAGAGFLWLFMDDRELMSDVLRISIGLIAVLFVVYQGVRRRLMKQIEQHPPGPWAARVLGAVAGASSMLAHAGGPPVTVYVIQRRLERKVFVGTTVVIFTAINLAKLAPYAALELIDLTNLKISLLLLPFVPLGVWLGIYLNRRVNERLFNTIIYVILFLTGVKLLTDFDPVKAVMAWMG